MNIDILLYIYSVDMYPNNEKDVYIQRTTNTCISNILSNILNICIKYNIKNEYYKLHKIIDNNIYENYVGRLKMNDSKYMNNNDINNNDINNQRSGYNVDKKSHYSLYIRENKLDIDNIIIIMNKGDNNIYNRPNNTKNTNKEINNKKLPNLYTKKSHIVKKGDNMYINKNIHYVPLNNIYKNHKFYTSFNKKKYTKHDNNKKDIVYEFGNVSLHTKNDVNTNYNNTNYYKNDIKEILSKKSYNQNNNKLKINKKFNNIDIHDILKENIDIHNIWIDEKYMNKLNINENKNITLLRKKMKKEILYIINNYRYKININKIYNIYLYNKLYDNNIYIYDDKDSYRIKLIKSMIDNLRQLNMREVMKKYNNCDIENIYSNNSVHGINIKTINKIYKRYKNSSQYFIYNKKDALSDIIIHDNTNIIIKDLYKYVCRSQLNNIKDETQRVINNKKSNNRYEILNKYNIIKNLYNICVYKNILNITKKFINKIEKYIYFYFNINNRSNYLHIYKLLKSIDIKLYNHIIEYVDNKNITIYTEKSSEVSRMLYKIIYNKMIYKIYKLLDKYIKTIIYNNVININNNKLINKIIIIINNTILLNIFDYNNNKSKFIKNSKYIRSLYNSNIHNKYIHNNINENDRSSKLYNQRSGGYHKCDNISEYHNISQSNIPYIYNVNENNSLIYNSDTKNKESSIQITNNYINKNKNENILQHKPEIYNKYTGTCANNNYIIKNNLYNYYNNILNKYVILKKNNYTIDILNNIKNDQCKRLSHYIYYLKINDKKSKIKKYLLGNNIKLDIDLNKIIKKKIYYENIDKSLLTGNVNNKLKLNYDICGDFYVYNLIDNFNNDVFYKCLLHKNNYIIINHVYYFSDLYINYIYDSKRFITNPHLFSDYFYLSNDSKYMLNLPNAGGTSIISEVFSFEILHRYYGAKLSATETQIQYCNSGSKKTDYSVIINNNVYAVSVTRCFSYNDGVYITDKYAYDILDKKITAILFSNDNVIKLYSWKKQLLHIFTDNIINAIKIYYQYFDIIQKYSKIYKHFKNHFIIITVCKNSDFIFNK